MTRRDGAPHDRGAPSLVMSDYVWTGRAYVQALGHVAIILDLVGDRYFRVALDTSPPGVAPAEFNAAAQERLSDAGLLQRRDRRRDPAPSHDAFAVLHACAWAHLHLRAKRLHHAIAQLAYLKALGREDKGIEARQAFEKWRPLYPHDYVCLIDSLALARYLLRSGMRPDFVIGVRDAPFSAHAWVALDGEVVNDRLGQWASYHPILAV